MSSFCIIPTPTVVDQHHHAPAPRPIHSYYKLMYSLAAKGDPRAQKEYAAWLRKLEKAKKAYQEAYDNEEVEQLAGYGYEVRGLFGVGV